MKIISFLLYYSKLRLEIMLGIHQTANPLDVKWQWKFWRYKKAARRSR
jgi:hypothetical protein